MTYLDRLAELLYLTPRPSGIEVEEGLRQMGLEFPLRIVVVRNDDQMQGEVLWRRGNKYFWAPHPGLIYVLWGQPSGKRTQTVAFSQLQGEVLECGAPERFVGVLLNAIVSFRRREMQDVMECQPQDLSFAAELDARRLAHKKILLAATEKTPFAQREWHAAVDLWLDIILLRHQIHLHTVRRKLQEFLSLLTIECDKGNTMGNCYFLASQFIQKTYSVAELRAGFSTWVTEILEVFPGREEWQMDALSPFCRQAVEWMSEHYNDPVSVSDCAAAIPLNSSYLSRLFKEEMGQSPVHFLQKLRIDYARRLLGQNRHSMQEIARQCGFGSVEHFHRVFVRLVGMTPARYRRNTRPQG